MYYRCIPFSWTFDTFWLIYRWSDVLHIVAGNLILVPLKNKIELALCMWNIDEDSIDIDLTSIKAVEWKVSDTIFLDPNQRKIIEYVSSYYITPIHNALWIYFPKNLIEKISKDTVSKIKISEYSYNSPEFNLTENQQHIYTNITSSKQNKHIIYWVTGSGKTEIYIKLISECLKQWKQSLLLIPEIILTSQIWERLQSVFGDEIIILNSSISAAKKSKYWMDIYYWNAKIVIGTRSSLFYPFNNLWLIIIDEEHDSSYISDSAPRYHTLDVAEKLSEFYDIPLVLGSWTPRATTLYRWLKWDFKVHQLLEKYND